MEVEGGEIVKVHVEIWVFLLCKYFEGLSLCCTQKIPVWPGVAVVLAAE